ncbi:MAG TPA: GTPase Era [Oligoflexia bacterium]|nr:GTPase Era [Oligoflexia bacterium]
MARRSSKRAKGSCREFRSGFIALAGPANAGKSTLLNALVGSKISIVSPKEQTTRNRILGIKTLADAQMIFVDTPGFMARHYRGELARYIGEVVRTSAADADQVVLVLDALRLLANEKEPLRVRAAANEKGIHRIAVIAVNKIDRVDKRRLLPLLARLADLFSGWTAQDGAPDLVPVSALTGDGIAELERIIAGKLAPGPAYFPADMLTDQSKEFIAAEVVREKLMLKLGEELPYFVAVQVEGMAVEKKTLHIKAVILVDKPSQKAIVIGRNGMKLKAVGEAARKDLERFCGGPIYLELFVRVEPKWTMTKRGISKAGYGHIDFNRY